MHPNLTAKIGPLPAWAWGAIVGLGLVGFLYLHGRSSAASSSDTAGDPTGTAQDATDLGNAPDFAGPTSGLGTGTDSFQPAPPASLRIDPKQWARLQAELAAERKQLRDIRKHERAAHRSPKQRRKADTTAHRTGGS